MESRIIFLVREKLDRGIGDKQCFNYALIFTRLGAMAIWWCMELHTDINMIKKTHLTKKKTEYTKGIFRSRKSKDTIQWPKNENGQN
jgi:hypothetical protein